MKKFIGALLVLCVFVAAAQESQAVMADAQPSTAITKVSESVTVTPARATASEEMEIIEVEVHGKKVAMYDMQPTPWYEVMWSLIKIEWIKIVGVLIALVVFLFIKKKKKKEEKIPVKK